MSDLESDNGVFVTGSGGDLLYNRHKDGRVFYWCGYCGHENIKNIDKHFMNLKKKDGQFIFGFCDYEINNKKSFKISSMINRLLNR